MLTTQVPDAGEEGEVAEPGTFSLLGIGLAAGYFGRKIMRRKAA